MQIQSLVVGLGFGWVYWLSSYVLIWVCWFKRRIFVLGVQKVGCLAWVWLCFLFGVLGLRFSMAGRVCADVFMYECESEHAYTNSVQAWA